MKPTMRPGFDVAIGLGFGVGMFLAGMWAALTPDRAMRLRIKELESTSFGELLGTVAVVDVAGIVVDPRKLSC